jgi:hypothetical protein
MVKLKMNSDDISCPWPTPESMWSESSRHPLRGRVRTKTQREHTSDSKRVGYVVPHSPLQKVEEPAGHAFHSVKLSTRTAAVPAGHAVHSASWNE